MKSRIGRFVGLSIWLIVILIACERDNARKIVADVDGQKIYLDEVDNLITNSLYEYLFAIFDARSIAANELISSKVLAIEARSRDISIDSLVLLETMRIGKIETKAKYVLDNALQAGVVDEKRPLELLKLNSSEGKKILEDSYQKFLKVRLVEELRAKHRIELSLERPKPPKIKTEGALTHVRGKINSAISITIITDFDCLACKRAYAELRELYKKYKDRIRFEVINLSQGVTTAVLFSECAGRQGRFWDAYEALFAGDVYPTNADTLITRLALEKTECLKCLKSERLNSELVNSMRRLRSVGIEITPTILIDHRIYYSPIESATIGKYLDELLAKGGTN